MNRFYCVILAWVLQCCGAPQSKNYLSHIPEDEAVHDFAPELWEKDNTFKGAFSDDYQTFYFFRKQAPGIEKYMAYRAMYGQEIAPESLSYQDTNQSYTYQLTIPGTNQLVFLSDLKTQEDTAAKSNYNFWYTEIEGEAFSKPKELFDETDLTQHYNSQPCITQNGNLYFTADSPDWSKSEAYVAQKTDNGYAKPILFDPVNDWRKNKNWLVYEYCMAPDESYLIVCMEDREKKNSADLYISFQKEGRWTEPQLLNGMINSDETENFPVITADGRYLLFTRAFSEFKVTSTQNFLIL